MFAAIPGFILGVMISKAIVSSGNKAIQITTKNDMNLKIGTESIAIAAFCGILLPVVSLVYPLYESIQIPLRQALDVFSKNVDGLTVKFHNMTSYYDFRLNHILFGIYIISFGFITYIIIPWAMMNKALGTLFFWMRILFQL